jgi:hypothetical protein
VHVDEHMVGAPTQLGQHRVGLGKRRTRGLQEEHPRQVHHAQAQAILVDHGEATARGGLRIVGGPDDPLVAVQQVVDVAVAEGVVAERDRVGARAEERGGDLGGDPHAAGGILAVDHDEVGGLALDQARQQPFDDGAAGRAHDVAYEEDLHAS